MVTLVVALTFYEFVVVEVEVVGVLVVPEQAQQYWWLGEGSSGTFAGWVGSLLDPKRWQGHWIAVVESELLACSKVWWQSKF